jgi:hypothetical protein
VQRHLPVRAAVLEREHAARLGAHEHDRVAREAHAVRLAALHFARPRKRVPVIGVDVDAAQVARCPLRRDVVGTAFLLRLLRQRCVHVRCLRMR